MSTKVKPHPGLSYRQQSRLAKALGIKFDEVPEAMKDWQALKDIGLLDFYNNDKIGARCEKAN